MSDPPFHNILSKLIVHHTYGLLVRPTTGNSAEINNWGLRYTCPCVFVGTMSGLMPTFKLDMGAVGQDLGIFSMCLSEEKPSKFNQS